MKPLGGRSELERVASRREKAVVVQLEGIVVVVELGDAAQTALEERDARDQDPADRAAGHESEVGIARPRMDGVERDRRLGNDAAEPEAHRVEEGRAERVAVLEDGGLTPGDRSDVLDVERVRSRRLTVIPEIGCGQTVPGRESVVQAHGEEVFARGLLADEGIGSGIAAHIAVGQGVEVQVGHDSRIDGDGPGDQPSGARGGGGHRVRQGHPEILT